MAYKEAFKEFVGVNLEVYDGRLVLVDTSKGISIYDENGLTLQEVIDFFLLLAERKKPNEVFICYASQSDNEFLFQTLPHSLKDKAFQNLNIRAQEQDLQEEIAELDLLSTMVTTVEEQAEAYFNKCVNKLSLEDLIDVTIEGVNVRLINGKLLTVKKSKAKKFLMYDCFGFFRKPIYDAVKSWLGDDDPKLKRSNRTGLETLNKQRLKEYSRNECRYIVKLMQKLYDKLNDNGIKITKFYGATAISSWVLSRSKAKDQFHNYRFRRQLGEQLHRAVQQGYYGGRTEQLKVGTAGNGVYVYDINSAYAHAAINLPPLLSKPEYAKSFVPIPFSLWYCDYDLTGKDCYYGLLPNRKVGNAVNFPYRGHGYFWYPEVEFLLSHYPDCVNVRHGFIGKPEQAEFTKDILALYDLRLKLQAQGDPLEKILKLALASIYGKFVQRDGGAYYYNLLYGGYITSHTRAAMLKAAESNPASVICFLTDAIHTTEPLEVELGNGLGQWKVTEYSKAEYVDLGIYRLFDANGNPVKTRTMGYRDLDFDKALTELESFRVYTALSEFFIGHNLHTMMPIRFADYLQTAQEEKIATPFESRNRFFNSKDVDLTQALADSVVVDAYSGRESGVYHHRLLRDSDIAKDALLAHKV